MVSYRASSAEDDKVFQRGRHEASFSQKSLTMPSQRSKRSREDLRDHQGTREGHSLLLHRLCIHWML